MTKKEGMKRLGGRQGDEALERWAGIRARSSRRCGLALWAGEARAIFNGMEILADIAASIARHTPGDGFHATPLERLSLVRSSTPTMPMPNVYRPLLFPVAQGSKHVVLGDRVFTERKRPRTNSSH